MRFLDTNILLYSISTAPEEAAKGSVAVQLLRERNNAMSVQVLQEFYVQATRPTRRDAVPHAVARGLIRAWLRFPMQDLTLSITNDALDIKVAARLSYWDATIIAAARALGCSELLSEDMQHGREIGGVKIVNPFRLTR
jgi:predicted nucleic acid-binding protein